MVRFLPMLISRFATVGSREVDIQEEPDRNALLVWALAVFAASHQRLGHTYEAMLRRQEANKQLAALPTTAFGEAELRLHEAEWWPESPHALTRIDSATELFIESGNGNRAAKALGIRGKLKRKLRQGSGALDWTRALELVDVSKPRGRWVASEVLEWLLVAAKKDLFFDDQDQAVVRLAHLARNGRSRRTEAQATLQWIIGVIYLNLGIHVYGRQWLRRARKHFLRLGKAPVVVEISLAMACSMTTDSERLDLAPLAEETVRDLQRSGRPDLATRLEPWRLHPDALDEVQRLQDAQVWRANPKLPSVPAAEQELMTAVLKSLQRLQVEPHAYRYQALLEAAGVRR